VRTTGAVVALGILFGEGDFMKSINVTTQVGDYTDADCNAANVASVVAAMHGFKAIPQHFVTPLHNRIYGAHMGPLKFGFTGTRRSRTLPVTLQLSARRTCLLTAHGAP
jgi:hypothetical protein